MGLGLNDEPEVGVFKLLNSGTARVRNDDIK